MPTGAEIVSAGVNATSTRIGALRYFDMDEVMTCYRHPDRETRVSCSECGRGICPDCMVFAPVGIRCPDHAGVAQGAQRVTRGVRRATFEGGGALVTKVLIGINLAVYALNLAQGSSLNRTSGWLFDEGALVVLSPWGGVGDGEWWRLITAAFLHGSIIHIALNMVVLWMIGAPVEEAIGRGRFLAIYIISGLAGSAGALLFDPNAITVGASGAIFGILGAALVLEQQRNYVLGGSALSFLVINLIITFAIPNISIGAAGRPSPRSTRARRGRRPGCSPRPAPRSRRRRR
jgi:membrane associated rhomboid family serine protease